MNIDNLTFTITTCRRLSLFMRTMESFLLTCEDKDKIKRWIVVDDHSSLNDISYMENRYPFLEIHNSPGIGQAASINHLHSLVTSDWTFHCEDDWEFVKSGKYITHLFDIAKQNERIKNVTLRNWEGDIRQSRNKQFNYNLHKYRSEYVDQAIIDKTNCRWYGYTFNPGIHHIPTIQMLGRYDEKHPVDCRRWDRTQARRYMLMGYQVANVVDKYIEHIGEGKSIYTD